ncbi:hypothetical protein ARMSODRAFT_970065 [Armillaria solidipes]|uniref:Uncharacterized protein n=1 Tax=Armillaria solidipes TaxID=1076256 RepID=A0A2H3C831_9AGAR|nr:hypothetical protein ARMSODRAFT_970065 [Armillaria solidipes]
MHSVQLASPIPDFKITLLAYKIHWEDRQLVALTDNLIWKKSIETALTWLHDMQTEILEAHDAIYSAAGVCKEWSEAEGMIQQFKRVIDYVEDIKCHILKRNLKMAWEEQSLTYQQHL